MKKIFATLVILTVAAVAVACSSAPSESLASENTNTSTQALVSLGCPLPPFGTFAAETVTTTSDTCVGVDPTLVEMVSLVDGNTLPKDYPWNAYGCDLIISVTSASQSDGSCTLNYNVNACNVSNYSEGYIGSANFHKDGGGVWHMSGSETMHFHGNPFAHQNMCVKTATFAMN